MSDNEKFKIGDIVRLKTKSPQMTITEIQEDKDGNTLYQCTWYSIDSKNFHKELFPANAIDKS